MSEFGNMDQDRSIYMFADALELIEKQYPKLARKDAKQHKEYSQRLSMWRLGQDNDAFEAHFSLHSKKAKEAQAVARNSDEPDEVRAKAKGLQSYHAKMSTKPCRYAPHIDHLVKAWKQKNELEEYRQEVLDQDHEDDKAWDKLSQMSMLDWADRLAAENPTRAQTVGLPYWERVTSSSAGKLAQAIVQFLSDQGQVLERFLANPVGAVLKPGCESRKGVGDITLYGTAELQEKLKNLDEQDLSAVKQQCKALLCAPWWLYKLSSIASKLKGSQDILDVAGSILHICGFVRQAAWKPSGTTGKAPVYVARHSVPDKELDADFHIVFTDVLYNMFSVRLRDYAAGLQAKDPSIKQAPPDDVFFSTEGRVRKETLEQALLDLGSYLSVRGVPPAATPQASEPTTTATPVATVSAAAAAGFDASQMSIASESQCSGAALEASGSNAFSSGMPSKQVRITKRAVDPCEPREIHGKAVDEVKNMLKWICCSSKQVMFRQTYLLQKVMGATEQDYEVLCNFLNAAGLAEKSISGKGGGKGGLTLRRPETADDLEHVAASFKVWFGVDEAAVKCFVDKMQSAEVSKTFSREVFELVMAAVNTHGSKLLSNKFSEA